MCLSTTNRTGPVGVCSAALICDIPFDMTDKPDLAAAYDLQSPDDSRRLYRTWARTYDAEFVDAHGFRMPRRVAEVYLAEGGGWPCLDVGCGTGAIGQHMPRDAILDGLDISPDMLAVAAEKGCYRHLLEGDLTRPLELPDANWAGFVSSGTFTTGHVGPDALARICALLESGATAAFAVKTSFYEEAAFATHLAHLEGKATITKRKTIEEPIYENGRAPQGHEKDTALIVTFHVP